MCPAGEHSRSFQPLNEAGKMSYPHIGISILPRIGHMHAEESAGTSHWHNICYNIISKGNGFVQPMLGYEFTKSVFKP